MKIMIIPQYVRENQYYEQVHDFSEQANLKEYCRKLYK